MKSGMDTVIEANRWFDTSRTSRYAKTAKPAIIVAHEIDNYDNIAVKLLWEKKVEVYKQLLKVYPLGNAILIFPRIIVLTGSAHGEIKVAFIEISGARNMYMKVPMIQTKII